MDYVTLIIFSKLENKLYCCVCLFSGTRVYNPRRHSWFAVYVAHWNDTKDMYDFAESPKMTRNVVYKEIL